jgi:hypothetical protein
MARVEKISKHIVVSIDGAIAAARSGDKTILALFNAPDFPTIIKDLEEMKVDGWEVVPSENCDNYDRGRHCLGHRKWVNEDENKQ